MAASPADPPSLKYARVETERRFLVRAVPAGVSEVAQIVDFYLDGTRLRLREVTAGGVTTRKLGHKVRLGAGPEAVAHTSVYLDQAEWDLLAALPARRLAKRRHQVRRDGVTLAVDEFPDGTLVAEIDGGDQRPPDPPPWLEVIREVTGEEDFTGAGRARAAAGGPAPG